jgi:hypothetical protein
MKFKKGDRVVIVVPSLESVCMKEVWNGVRGTVVSADYSAFNMAVDDRRNNKGEWGGYAGFYNEWGRLEVPLTPFEELIAAYIAAEKKEFGL